MIRWYITIPGRISLLWLAFILAEVGRGGCEILWCFSLKDGEFTRELFSVTPEHHNCALAKRGFQQILQQPSQESASTCRGRVPPSQWHFFFFSKSRLSNPSLSIGSGLRFLQRLSYLLNVLSRRVGQNYQVHCNWKGSLQEFFMQRTNKCWNEVFSRAYFIF